jgi:hypothetical protein
VRPTAGLVLASLAFVFVTHQVITAAGYAPWDARDLALISRKEAR